MTTNRSSDRAAVSASHPDRRTLDRQKRQAEATYARVQAEGTPRAVAIYTYAMNQLCERDNTAPYQAICRLKTCPVTIDQFIEDEDYLGGRIKIWPALVADLRRMNPDVLVGEVPVHEALLGGATGTGKTTLSIVTALYQVYLLTCFRDVQAIYGLSPQTPIVFMFQSLTPAITQRVIYKPFRDAFEAMPYAQKYLKWNKSKQSVLEIAGGIVVVPELANVQSITGQAIAGGILDEVNFMVLVENSQRIVGPRGQGGKFDQAEQVYRNLSRRRKSRFATRGYSIGCLCILSSTRYVGDFLDRRIAEVDRLGEDNGSPG